MSELRIMLIRKAVYEMIIKVHGKVQCYPHFDNVFDLFNSRAGS